MNRFLTLLVSLSFLFSNCQSKKEADESLKTSSSTSTFFNLKDFLETEIRDKLKNQKLVKKTVNINGKVETKDVEIKDWNEELKPFFNADINKPAWSDKYQSSEKPVGMHSKVKTYSTTEKLLKTKQLSIIEDDSTKQRTINIVTSDKTAVTQSDTQLVYESNSGYTISTQQKLLGTTDNVVIQVVFLKKE
jgi:hypothetical protein